MADEAPTDQTASAADSAFTQLAKQYVDESPGLSPVSATCMGDHRYDADVDDVSEASRARKAAFQREYLRRLDEIPFTELSPDQQVDAEMLRHHLRAGLWHLEVLQEWAWNPVGYAGLVGNTIYSLVARDFAPLPERLRSVTSRLEQLPRLIEQIRSTLDPARVPKLHAETASKQNRGVLSILERMVQPFVDELPPSDRDRLIRAIENAKRMVEAQQGWLDNEVLPVARGEERIGGERFDQKLAFALHSPMTRAQVRRKAEDELRRVRDEMYEIAARVAESKAPAQPLDEERQAVIENALEQAYSETPDVECIVELATDMLAEATSFVSEAGLVSMPEDPCEVIVMPEFRRGVTLAYCDSPGPLEKGQSTFYAIAPPPVDWTDEQVRSLLREYNLRSLRNLTIHEAMPGHYLQLWHSNRHPSTLRAMLGSGTFVEGWAIYSEHLMVERGFGGDDPLMRLMVLKWYLRSIANALLDQAVHVDGMTEADAMKLMTRDTFQEEREAAGKWTRARLTSSQLSTYFVGFQEHVALRKEMEKSWGSDFFSLRKYHDTLLSFGSPPTQHVRALMLGEQIR